MTKQEKIKEAYGIYWDTVKRFVDEDGWLDSLKWLGSAGNTIAYHKLEGIKLESLNAYDRKLCYSLWPKSLEGIDENNGWTKIESEDDLPKLTIEYYVLKNGCLTTAYYRGNNRWIIPENDYPKTTEIHKITHYQPIQKPKPPIY